MDGHFSISLCTKCNGYALWLTKEKILAWPSTAPYPPGEGRMPPPVAEIYDQARQVRRDSPAASAGLLRLALQLYLDQFGVPEGDLYRRIGILEEWGVPPLPISSMDAIRWGGNVGMHEGRVRPEDTAQISDDLFEAINLLAETAPRIAAVIRTHQAMPASVRDSIGRRKSVRPPKKQRT